MEFHHDASPGRYDKKMGWSWLLDLISWTKENISVDFSLAVNHNDACIHPSARY